MRNKELRNEKLKNKKLWLGICCLLAALAVLLIPALFKDKNFFVNYIDVGQGDSILIGCGGHYALVDGGGSTMNVTDKGQYVVVPYLKALGISHLDYCINTHPDADHIGGLFAVVDQMKVDNLGLHRDYGDNTLQKQLVTLAENRRTKVDYLGADDEIDLGGRVTVKVIAPEADKAFTAENVNEGSLVLRVTYGEFDVLLDGDLQGAEQKELLKRNEDWSEIEVLHIPHHGSKNSFDENWYGAFSPEAVMISVGKDNSYGHPYSEITAYWQNRGVKVFRTDIDGSVKITSDGKKGNYRTYVE